MTVLTTLAKYWPVIVAGLYLAYVVAAGQTAQIAGAVAAVVSALGLANGVVSAHSAAAEARAAVAPRSRGGLDT